MPQGISLSKCYEISSGYISTSSMWTVKRDVSGIVQSTNQKLYQLIFVKNNQGYIIITQVFLIVTVSTMGMVAMAVLNIEKIIFQSTGGNISHLRLTIIFFLLFMFNDNENTCKMVFRGKRDLHCTRPFLGGSQIMIWRLISNEYLALSYVCLTLIM